MKVDPPPILPHIPSHPTTTQWCSEKFSLVGTLAWHIPYGYREGGGVGVCLNELSFIKGKNPGSNII